MTTRQIKTREQLDQLLTFIGNQPLPFEIKVVKGARRSAEQNRLQRLWLSEISEQLGDRTPEEVRGYCKLTMGVPILRAENDEFREKYDRIVKPLSYEDKIEIMMEPLDMPVTRLMTTDQKTRYLDHMHRYWTEKGLILTEPNTEG